LVKKPHRQGDLTLGLELDPGGTHFDPQPDRHSGRGDFHLNKGRHLFGPIPPLSPAAEGRVVEPVSPRKLDRAQSAPLKRLKQALPFGRCCRAPLGNMMSGFAHATVLPRLPRVQQGVAKSPLTDG